MLSSRTAGSGVGSGQEAIEIQDSEQHARYVLTGGTISDSGGRWHCSTGAGVEEIPPVDAPSVSLQERWIQEIQTQDTSAAR